MGVHFPWLYPVWQWFACQPVFAQFMFKPWFHRMNAVPLEIWETDRRLAFQPGMRIPAFRTGQAIRSGDITARLSAVKAPVLAIYGRQDGVVPLADAYLVKRHLPNSQLLLLDQCGHYPMYEQPQAYLEAVVKFLAPAPEANTGLLG